MKKIIKEFLIVSIIIGFFSCNSFVVRNTPKQHYDKLEYSKDTIYIHFQGGFYNDSIKVLIKNEILFANTMVTNEVWGFAKELKIPKNHLNNKLFVQMKKDTVFYKIAIEEEEFINNFIGIWFSSKEGLKYYFRNKPFRYD